MSPQPPPESLIVSCQSLRHVRHAITNGTRSLSPRSASFAPRSALHPPRHLRCRSHPAAAGFVCVVVASYYTPQHPTSAAWGHERDRRPPPHCFSLLSFLQQSRRSRSIGLKDTQSRGLFMWGCRRQSSVSRKKLRNCCRPPPRLDNLGTPHGNELCAQ